MNLSELSTYNEIIICQSQSSEFRSGTLLGDPFGVALAAAVSFFSIRFAAVFMSAPDSMTSSSAKVGPKRLSRTVRKSKPWMRPKSTTMPNI